MTQLDTALEALYGRDSTEFLNASIAAVSYTHLRAHETVLDLVCRLLLANKNTTKKKQNNTEHRSESNQYYIEISYISRV